MIIYMLVISQASLWRSPIIFRFIRGTVYQQYVLWRFYMNYDSWNGDDKGFFILFVSILFYKSLVYLAVKIFLMVEKDLTLFFSKTGHFRNHYLRITLDLNFFTFYFTFFETLQLFSFI